MNCGNSRCWLATWKFSPRCFLTWHLSKHDENIREVFPNPTVDIWLVVWNIFFTFPYIGNFIIPSDELIFFRGVGQLPTRYGCRWLISHAQPMTGCFFHPGETIQGKQITNMHMSVYIFIIFILFIHIYIIIIITIFFYGDDDDDYDDDYYYYIFDCVAFK